MGPAVFGGLKYSVGKVQKNRGFSMRGAEFVRIFPKVGGTNIYWSNRLIVA